MDEVGSVADLVTLTGRLAREGVSGFVQPFVNTDDKDSSRYVVYLEQGGLGLPDEFFERIAVDLAGKRDVLSDGLVKAGFEVFASHASYFVVADARPLGYDDATQLCRELPELAGAVAVLISAFCHDDLAEEYSSLVRFAFCKRVDVLELAAAQLAGLARDR